MTEQRRPDVQSGSPPWKFDPRSAIHSGRSASRPVGEPFTVKEVFWDLPSAIIRWFGYAAMALFVGGWVVGRISQGTAILGPTAYLLGVVAIVAHVAFLLVDRAMWRRAAKRGGLFELRRVDPLRFGSHGLKAELRRRIVNRRAARPPTGWMIQIAAQVAKYAIVVAACTLLVPAGCLPALGNWVYAIAAEGWLVPWAWIVGFIEATNPEGASAGLNFPLADTLAGGLAKVIVAKSAAYISIVASAVALVGVPLARHHVRWRLRNGQRRHLRMYRRIADRWRPHWSLAIPAAILLYDSTLLFVFTGGPSTAWPLGSPASPSIIVSGALVAAFWFREVAGFYAWGRARERFNAALDDSGAGPSREKG